MLITPGVSAFSLSVCSWNLCLFRAAETTLSACPACRTHTKVQALGSAFDQVCSSGHAHYSTYLLYSQLQTHYSISLLLSVTC